MPWWDNEHVDEFFNNPIFGGQEKPKVGMQEWGESSSGDNSIAIKANADTKFLGDIDLKEVKELTELVPGGPMERPEGIQEILNQTLEQRDEYETALKQLGFGTYAEDGGDKNAPSPDAGDKQREKEFWDYYRHREDPTGNALNPTHSTKTGKALTPTHGSAGAAASVARKTHTTTPVATKPSTTGKALTPDHSGSAYDLMRKMVNSKRPLMAPPDTGVFLDEGGLDRYYIDKQGKKIYLRD